MLLCLFKTSNHFKQSTMKKFVKKQFGKPLPGAINQAFSEALKTCFAVVQIQTALAFLIIMLVATAPPNGAAQNISSSKQSKHPINLAIEKTISDADSLAVKGIDTLTVNCTSNVPVFTVDLTGHPYGTYVSPFVSREGQCCSAVSPNRSVRFNITLDPATIAIRFFISSGAIPSGSLSYSIFCSTSVPVGESICLNGPGPYTLTFTKPGNNQNTYAIEAFGKAAVENDSCASPLCVAGIRTYGLVDSTVTFSAIDSNCAICNSYLSSMHGTATSTVRPAPGAPAYCKFKVCGKLKVPYCQGIFDFCDSVQIAFLSNLEVLVHPPSTMIQHGDSVQLCADPSGGSGNYTYQWSYYDYVHPSIIIGSDSCIWAKKRGQYTVTVNDQLLVNCSDFAIAVVDSESLYLSIDSFSGKCTDDGIILKWVTYSQSGIVSIHIEKSIGSGGFNDIAEVAGSGNSNSISHFTYIDKSSTSSLAYYRLRLVDVNGNSFYSDVTVIVCNKNTPFEVFPVVYDSYGHSITVLFNSPEINKYKISLFNLSDQELYKYSETASRGVNKVYINDIYLSSDLYILVIIYNTKPYIFKVAAIKSD